MKNFESKQQLALLHLLFTNPRGGNEPQLGSSGLSGKEWQPLATAGLVEVFSKPKNRGKFVRATDEAWAWASSNLAGAAPARPKAKSLGVAAMQTRILAELLAHLHPFLESRGESVGSLFAARDATTEGPAAEASERGVFSVIKGLGATGQRIRIADVRGRLAELGRDELDAALLALQRAEKIIIYPLDNPSEITAADKGAALLIAGVPHHIVYREI
ncbi:MAG TPA: hypothetical protein VLC09_01570 [Polyangiaceae bacterium]|nr:hypothetical protein [Polyangiaceae bacterium]